MKIGTEERPVRCSSLPMLLTCSGFVMMRNLYSDESGVAATLGTAVGRGIELFHRGTDVEEAIKIALGEADGCLGEKEALEATKTIGYYAEDPRNGQLASTQVVVESLELEIKFEYRGVWFEGHTDQIRRHEDGRLYVWDVKHTKRYGGVQALDAYAAQLAAYSYGCGLHFGEPVLPGGIIRTTSYVSPKKIEETWVSERPVFFPADWPEGTVSWLMDQCVERVRLMNHATPSICPGDHCSWCPAQGVANCMRLLANA